MEKFGDRIHAHNAAPAESGIQHIVASGQRASMRCGGFRRSLAEWTTLEVYRKATSLLEKRGELTPRRRRAAAAQIWPVVRNLAKTQLDEAARGADWIASLDHGFVPPVRAPLRLAYRLLGFRRTEWLIRAWAFFRKPPPGPVG